MTYYYHSYFVTGDNSLLMGMPFPSLMLYYYADGILHTRRFGNCDTLFFLGRDILKDCDTGELFIQVVLPYA